MWLHFRHNPPGFPRKLSLRVQILEENSRTVRPFKQRGAGVQKRTVICINGRQTV